MNVEKWVDEKIALLEAGSGPLPDRDSVLERLNGRERSRRQRRNRLLAIGVPCLIGCAATATVISIRREPAPTAPGTSGARESRLLYRGRALSDSR